MENSIFWTAITLIFLFGFGGGLISSTYFNWRYWHKALSIGLVAIGLIFIYLGITIIIDLI